jgi:hypothetical protein
MYDSALCQMYGATGGIKQMGRIIDQKMVMVHGSPCEPTPLILLLTLM